MKKISAIVWDWNGTLLNDIDIVLETMNEILKRRNLPQITKRQHREHFGFPVKDYYEFLGFDFAEESFPSVSEEYNKIFLDKIPTCSLNQSIPELLKFFSSSDIPQFIVSAMEHRSLNFSVRALGIHEFFVEVAGLKDFLADSKIKLAQKVASRNSLINEETIMIGDTIHDYEVAKALGWIPVVVASGHQGFERFDLLECLKYKDFSDFFNKVSKPESMLDFFQGSHRRLS